MNKKQLQKFEKLLLQKKQDALDHIFNRRRASEEQLDEGPGDQVDIASTEISQAQLQKLGNREQNFLKKIDKALIKIESGEYGVCESCGEDIAPARLEARPEAVLCIDCKTLQEQKERQYMDEDEREDGVWPGEGGEEFSGD